MPISIRSRLLWLVLSALLPAVAAALLIIVRTFNVEQEALERNLRDTTRALSLVVDGELTRRAAIARVLSSSRLLDHGPDIPADNLASFELQARRAMQGMEGWVELDSSTLALLDTRLPSGAPPPPVRQPGARQLVERPLIGPLEAASTGGDLRAAAIQPVERNGRTVLNVSVTIVPAELQRIIDHQHLLAGWVAAIVDSRGTVVARHPGGTRNAGLPLGADLKALLARQDEALFESATLDGTPSVGVFSKSPSGWTYVTALPRAQFGGGVPAAVLQVGLGSLALLGLAVAGALWVSRRIVQPVQSLKEAAARMQAGLPVERRSTGMQECDEVVAALAEAAEAMQHARADLERQVAAAVTRTREAEQRVSRSQRVEALGRLTGGVAHDFNNLLGVISNSAYLIQRHATDPQLQVPLAATLRAVEVGSRLTQQLMRFAGRQPVRPQAIDLGSYLPEVQELMKMVLGKRIQVTVSVAPDTRRISVDSAELELALINLALNARDAMPTSGELWVSARNADEDDAAGLPGSPQLRYVLITVTDNGVGIDDSVAARVFEPFFTTKEVGKGTGLGLSQVHGFCVQAGGAARLASTQGLGTTVSLLLPASVGEVQRSAPAGGEPGQDSYPGLQHRRVLLVEDNEELADVTAALLATYGASAERASSPQQALERLAGNEPFDVVLSDIVMPGAMDGIALAHELRERRPELPVVLISGYSSALAGAYEFPVLHKPCTPEQLLGALQRAIEAR